MSHRGSNASSNNELRSRLDRHFAGCAAVIAGLAMVATAASADAAVVTTTVSITGTQVAHQTTSSATPGGIYIDFLDGTAGSTATSFGANKGTGAPNWNVHLWSGTVSDSGYVYNYLQAELPSDQQSTGSPSMVDSAVVSDQFYYFSQQSYQAQYLTPSTTISSASAFNFSTPSSTFSNSNILGRNVPLDYSDGIDPDFSDWMPGESGYLGVEFTGYNGSTYFGWVHLTYNTNYSFSVDQFAYDNTPDTPITIPTGSSVPEPASAALLGTLGLGSLALRPRRRKSV